MLTQDHLKSILHYDPETGVFTRLIAAGRLKVGDVAGVVLNNGYRVICVQGSRKRHCASHLAWLYVTGSLPEDQIDHRDGDRDNNRFTNLRPCTNAQNMQNKGLARNNTSGHPGVHFRKDNRRWLAKVGRKHVGLYATREDAIAARLAAKAVMHAFNPGERHV